MGVKLQMEVLDAGALIDAQYNYEGDTYAPDWDMFIWYWTQDVDPQFMLGIYTPQQIEGWNDCLWTDPRYTVLNKQQSQTIDENERKPIIDEMQQIFYDDAAYAILAYPYQLEAYNTDKWQGWVHVPERRRRRSGRRRPVQLQQHRYLPVRRAQERHRGHDEQQLHDHHRHRGRGRAGRRRRHLPPAAQGRARRDRVTRC